MLINRKQSTVLRFHIISFIQHTHTQNYYYYYTNVEMFDCRPAPLISNAVGAKPHNRSNQLNETIGMKWSLVGSTYKPYNTHKSRTNFHNNTMHSSARHYSTMTTEQLSVQTTFFRTLLCYFISQREDWKKGWFKNADKIKRLHIYITFSVIFSLWPVFTKTSLSYNTKNFNTQFTNLTHFTH